MSFLNPLNRLWLRLTYTHVGDDLGGNRYYARGNRRVVVYAGRAEATKVPPSWFLWLHRLSDNIPAPNVPAVTPNPTGSPAAYRPRVLREGWIARREAGVDYQAWRPGA